MDLDRHSEQPLDHLERRSLLAEAAPAAAVAASLLVATAVYWMVQRDDGQDRPCPETSSHPEGSP